MIKGIGVDTVKLARIERAIQRSHLEKRVLTPAEYEHFVGLNIKRQVEFLAGRFAAKEAFSKAWGTGIGAVAFKDLEVLNNKEGAPYFTYSPHDGQVHLSITHTDQLATAFVVLA